MTIDLHDALTTLVAAAPRSQPPTTALLRRVHRRRASRAMTTSAVGVVAAGAAATSSLGWWPDLSFGPGPADDDVATPATEAPAVVGSTAAWDLYPDASLDVGTAPTRTVTEALAAVTVVTATEGARASADAVFLMDATDGTWVHPAWPTAPAEVLQVLALSPDGATLAVWVLDPDDVTGVALVDIATGTSTSLAGLQVAGSRCMPAGADYAPDGTLAVLATCDPESGPVVVFAVQPGEATASALVTIEGVNLSEGGTLEYSPDGSLLAIGSYEVDGPPAPRTTVVRADGTVLREWPAALRSETSWYGNDALRATELERTDLGEWKGWLIPSTGAAIGQIRSYDEYPWEYGPAPALLGATHGQELRPHTARVAGTDPDDDRWAFDIEDTATGSVRAWLPVFDSTAPADRQPTVFVAGTSLAHRAR